jgi:hypothetical protein
MYDVMCLTTSTTPLLHLSYQMQYLRQWRLLDGYRAGHGKQHFPGRTGS